MEAKASINIQESVDDLKERALDKLSIYLSVSAVFLFVAFLYRLTDVDWQNAYYLQFTCFFLFVIVFSVRKKLSYKVTIYSYLLFGFIVTATEFISLGLSGMGEIASLFCIMLSFFYLDRKSTAVVALIIITIFFYSQYQFLYAGHTPSANDLAYMSWRSAWVGRLVADTAFFMIIGMSVYYLQDQIISLLLKVERQKKTIEAQKKQIEELANRDALTGLPSVRVADHRLEEVLWCAKEQRHESALLFLDLDGFKTINDTYGHAAGDEVLKRVARRISSALRSNDIACRIGGDEFLVIVEKIADRRDIEKLCQRLINTIGSPMTYHNAELTVGVSIGAASYPHCAKSSGGLRLKADEMMYRVKKSGKNNYLISMEGLVSA
ncbi:GGDEF domain-containing protein [Leucothrix pacifica]|uniref:GGDEF domain-containing protein n=1 Tax=Leucothrix pacifica TaxID=1247513 RepID=A0A317CIB6_9GAMM|nr:GGDEF domain-containing protein [Leucothrix pacifica]PWQ98246.1 hypothetical protein DKW60_08455 [Leucothrix pacifica]